MENFQELFKKFSSVKVGVIGDVMLDTYMWGDVDRVSPEAPVPIVSLKKRELRIGGAGNVALNIQSLGAKPFVISVTGDDDDADKLDSLFTSQKINCTYCVRSKERITTNKTRVKLLMTCVKRTRKNLLNYSNSLLKKKNPTL